MTLLILILIAIPVCILTILLWIYNDYKKYKRQNCFLILLFLALPATIQAQYTDKNWLSGNIWLVSFKISYLCLPLFYETRTTPSCHPSGCAYRQL